jgi:hypothetical protein
MTNETLDVPVEALRLNMPENLLTLAAEERDEDGKVTRKPRFKMQVNSGIPMAHWWHGTLAVNLSGIRWEGAVGALLDHDPSQRVGYTTKLYLDDELGLVAEGVMLSNDDAQRVRLDSKEGYPWQASCYLVAEKILRLDDGVEHEVNGHTITGPALVFEASHLREVTFCALGADSNTSSDASLAEGEGERIRVPLSVKESTMTKQNDETAEQPAAPQVDTEAIALEARNAEQARVNDILELAHESQMTLAKDLISKGTNALEAAKALSADLRKKDAEAAPAAQPTPATAALSAPAPAPTSEQLDATKDLPEGEDKWKQQWAEDASLRAEFQGNENVWLSYSRNKDKCRDFGGSKQAFDATEAK